MQWIQGQTPGGLATLSPGYEAKCYIDVQILTLSRITYDRVCNVDYKV